MPTSMTWPVTSAADGTKFLRLNGIAMPVALAGAGPGREFIGQNRRAADGTMVAPRRGRKGVWRFSTAIRTAEEALAWRDLVEGEGHVLSFDSSNWYTSQGMAPVSVAGGWSFSAVGPKYGAACASWTTGNAVWAFFESGSPWTLGYWLNVGGGGWNHVLVNSEGSTWLNGLPGGSLPAGWASLTEGFGGVAAGVATFGSLTASKIDDIVALPYVVPSDWPLQIHDFGEAFGLLPVVKADGLFIENDTAVKSVIGGEPAGRVTRGASLKNLHDFAFELFER